MKVKVYQWLKGDGNAYIDTKFIPTEPADLRLVFSFKNGFVGEVINGVGISGYQNTFGILTSETYGKVHVAYNGISPYSNTPIDPRNGVYDVAIKNRKAYDHGEYLYDISTYLPKYEGTFLLFTRRYGASGMASVSANVRYSRCEIGGKILVPCLTETNEACMLDLLSGDLYRNQGSGAFSVEGECLYEFETPSINRMMRRPSIVVRMREWLVQGGRAYIVTDIKPRPYEDAISLVFKDNLGANRESKNNSDGYEENLFGYDYSNMTNRANGLRLYWSSVYNMGVPFLANGNTPFQNWGKYLVSQENGTNYTINIDALTNDGISRVYGSVDGVDFDKSRNVDGVLEQEVQHEYGVFTCNRNNYKVQTSQMWANVSFKSVKIVRNGATILDLRPCDILLHPTLPPQSAMIDPNTGTIYTNQGSGNFTCEGADLGIWADTMVNDMRIKDVKAHMVCVMQNGEPRVVWERTQPWVEHKWLKGNNGAHINTLLQSNSVNYVKFIGRNTDKQMGYPILCGNQKFDDFAIGVFQGIEYYARIKGIQSRIGDGQSQQLFEYEGILGSDDSVITIFSANQNGWRNFSGEISAVTLGDTLHLTPIQLTRNLFPHEIASANSALRGECGFADKEKYLRGEPWYFGNIAKTGAFGVSDE